MRLDIGSFPVDRIEFGSQTRWANRTLEVNRQELIDLALEDSEIERADIQIASPGESARVMNYVDVIEPKVKVNGPGVIYPGICGRPTRKVGFGRTHRLANCAVVQCVDTTGVPDEELYVGIRRQTGATARFFDLCEPNNVTPFATLNTLCLVFQFPRGVNPEDRHRMLQSATLRVSDRLAEAVADLEPPEIEHIDLTPKADLPGAVFIPHLSSQEWVFGARSSQGIAVYGQGRLSAPWLLDGTEMLDGAVSQGHTWYLANNPVVTELCRRHGKTLNFRGCIVQRTNWTAQSEKEMAAERAAHLAEQIGAQSAILTTDIRGQRFVETTLTLQECERRGIKTVLLTEEEDPEGGNAPPFILCPPEMEAVVSTGTGEVPRPFPPVERVVGFLDNPEPKWYGEQPPIPGRYGAYHIRDLYGFGKQSLADY